MAFGLFVPLFNNCGLRQFIFLFVVYSRFSFFKCWYFTLIFCFLVDPIIFTFLTILGASLGVKVISTQNPVYSGLYFVLPFCLGSAISFLLGVEWSSGSEREYG